MSQYYFDIIPLNFTKHSYVTKPYLYYFRNISTNQYTLSEILDTNLFQTSQIFCYNKKYLLQLFSKIDSNINVTKIYDINFLQHIPIKYEFETIDVYKFWQNGEYKFHKNLNKFIPNIKHLEYLENKYQMFENFLQNFDTNLLQSDYVKFYNETFITTFTKLEQTPINFHKKIYSNYNLYNKYSRPTNVSNGINFTALSKKNEDLKNFIPNNDIFVEFDYTSYQIHLLYNLLNIEHNGDIYKDLCKLYKIDDRDEAKKKTLILTFGDSEINPYPNNKFFTKLFELKNLLKTVDVFTSPISGKQIELIGNSGDISKILQIIETEKNVIILEQILEYLNEKFTKLVLYKYDAFLFDVCYEDGVEVLKDLEQILMKNGDVSMKHGKNYFEICN